MKILLHLNAQQKGFFTSLAKCFAGAGHDVVITSALSNGTSYFKSVLQQDDRIEFVDDADLVVDVPSGADFIGRLTDYEQRYDTTFSFLMSQDRGLGRGYLLNVDRYPDRFDAWISYEEKCTVMLGRMMMFEKLIDEICPDVLITTFIPPYQECILEKRQIPGLSVGLARCSNKGMLFTDSRLRNYEMEETLDAYLKSPGKLGNYQPEEFVRDNVSSKVHSAKDYSYIQALKKSSSKIAWEIWQGFYYFYKFRKFTGQYKPFAWVPSIFRRVRNYKLICRSAVTTESISEYKVAYFPLHLEPEIALLSVSPEFNNSLEAICWLSKSLPADYLLVVREHPLGLGVRSQTYYDFLRQMPNVRLAHPDIDSWDWIKRSDLVATVTGSVAYEAVRFGRPLISFGRDQLFNRLPAVRLAIDYDSTRKAVTELIGLKGGDASFDLSRRALFKTLDDWSFDAPGFVDSYAKTEAMSEAAKNTFCEIIEFMERRLENRSSLISG